MEIALPKLGPVLMKIITEQQQKNLYARERTFSAKYCYYLKHMNWERLQ